MSRPELLVGVILAAGRGTRLHPLNLEDPRPLLPICNQPIIWYQLEDMRRVGIGEVFVVVAHVDEQMSRVLARAERELGLRIHHIDQGRTLGIAHAVLQLEKHISSPFLVFLGDIFIAAPRLNEMVALFRERQAGAVLAVKRESDPAAISRNFAIYLDEDGRVTRVVEKPRVVQTDLKGCGLYLFSPDMFDALRRTPRSAHRDEYEITDAVQIFIDQGFDVHPSEAVDRDAHLMVACDLLEVNLNELRMRGGGNCIGAAVVVPKGSTIDNSVIGDGVVFERPCVIRNSLVFAGTVVPEAHIEDSIVTPALRLHCDSSFTQPKPGP